MNLNTVFVTRTFNKTESCTIRPSSTIDNKPGFVKSNLKIHKNKDYQPDTMHLLGFGKTYNPYVNMGDDEDDEEFNARNNMQLYSDVIISENSIDYDDLYVDDILLFGTYKQGNNYKDKYGNIYYITEISKSKVKFIRNANMGKLKNSVITETRNQFLDRMGWKNGDLMEYYE